MLGAGGDVGRQLRTSCRQLLCTAISTAARSYYTRAVLQPRPAASRRRRLDPGSNSRVCLTNRGGSKGRPVKILPLPCGPPMKFMIKHNLPLVTCGSLWQHRSVPPSCNYGPPTVPPKCKPQNRHCSSTILSKTLWFYHSLQRKQWLSLSIPNWSSVYIMKVVYIEISACTIFYKETGISTVDFTETFPFYHIYGQPYTPDYHQQDKQTDRRNFFTIANHYKVTVG